MFEVSLPFLVILALLAFIVGLVFGVSLTRPGAADGLSFAPFHWYIGFGFLFLGGFLA